MAKYYGMGKKADNKRRAAGGNKRIRQDEMRNKADFVTIRCMYVIFPMYKQILSDCLR
jgi:hypothetical protein